MVEDTPITNLVVCGFLRLLSVVASIPSGVMLVLYTIYHDRSTGLWGFGFGALSLCLYRVSRYWRNRAIVIVASGVVSSKV